MSTEPKAVVLLSGGLDSATCVAIAREVGFVPYGLTVEYGQRHVREIEAAGRIAADFAIAEHMTARVDLGRFGGSALTADIPVPPGADPAEGGGAGEIPITYVPARNTVFLSMALAWAETLGAADIFIGANAVDYSGYPDCRPAFIEAFESLANVATKAAVEGRARFRIHAPLLELSKADIIRRGVALGVDYGRTWSCYDPTPEGVPCRKCDSCRLREAGFTAAGLSDPLLGP